MRSLPRRVALSLLVLAACADPGVGSVELALTGQSSGGQTYRLRDATLAVVDDDGASVTALRTEDPR
jgi:hypothetical protein